MKLTCLFAVTTIGCFLSSNEAYYGYNLTATRNNSDPVHSFMRGEQHAAYFNHSHPQPANERHLRPKKSNSDSSASKSSKKSKKNGNKMFRRFQKEGLFIPGLLHEMTPEHTRVISDEGIEYDVFADLTTRKEGLVSLAAVADSIESIACVNDESVAIDFTEALTLEQAVSLFPINSLLLVKAAIFGACMENLLLSNDSPDFDANLYAQAVADETGDGYLVIEDVRVSATTIEVLGHRGQFFDMFDDGHVEIIPVVDGNADEANRHLGRSLAETTATLEKKVSWNPFKDVPWFDLDVGATFKLIATMGMGLATFDFGWWGIDIVITDASNFQLEVEGKVEFGIPLRQGVPPTGKIHELLEELIAPPALKLMNLVKKAKIFDTVLQDVPEIKVGLYAELISFWKIEELKIAGEYPLVPKAKITYSTGRKERSTRIFFTPFADGKKIGVGPPIFERSDDSQFDSKLEIPQQSSTEVQVSAMWVVQPQLALYFTSDVYAGLGLPAGPVLKAKAKLDAQPYGPLAKTGFFQLGYCNVCHYIESEFAFEVRSPLFGANFKTPEFKKGFITIFPAYEESVAVEVLPEAKASLKLGDGCFVTQFGENTIACQDPDGNYKCCDSTFQECDQITGECKDLVCDTSNPNCGEERDYCRDSKSPFCCDKSEDPCCGRTEPCCDPEDDCCHEYDPYCGLTSCRAESLSGHCINKSNMQESILLKFFSHDCASNEICQIDSEISCSIGEYEGSCTSPSWCLNNGGRRVRGLCPGPADSSQCCLYGSETRPGCVANERFPGECMSVGGCNGLNVFSQSTGWTPLPSPHCTSGEECCVESPQCFSSTTIGNCLHEDACKFEKIAKSDPAKALCPGGNSIQCCMELPACEVGGQNGQCRDKDNCGPGKHPLTGACPGDSEVKCCVQLPSCSVAGESGDCLPASECSGLPAMSWHDCPGRTSDDTSCCLDPGLICFAPSGETGECKTSCSRVASGSNLCPNGLFCCLSECDNTIEGIDCCDDVDCAALPHYECNGNKCVCAAECCSDTECGDETVYECIENQCRVKECDADNDPSIECCNDNDCDFGMICEESFCISNGNPRFTLTWFGDDDLDLHVITPNGFEIYWNDDKDPISNGQLDHDDIPEEVGRWAENIYFPMDGSAPKGIYTYFVDTYEDPVGEPDNWNLLIFLGDTRVRRHTKAGDSGVNGNDSEHYTFMFE